MDLTIQGVINILNNFACWLMSIMVAVMIIFIIIAGIRFMLAGGNSEKYTKAKKNLGYLLIGILVIYGVGVILSTVAGNLGDSSSTVSRLRLIPFRCNN